MTLLACDPGSTRSAYVVYDDRVVVASDRVPNESMLGVVDRYASDLPADAFVIEKVEGYGMPVGVEIFETVFWSGRFAERWLAQRRPGSLHRIGRKAVKRFMIGPIKRRDPRSRHSADKLIRDALIEMYGPGEHRAIGSFDHPGPLYRISRDQWAALALAVAFEGLMKSERMTLFN